MMRWRRLFNIGISIQALGVRGEARPISAGEEVTKGAFITPQSLVTFPVATFVVGLLWKVIEAVFPQTAGALWVPLVISFLLGTFVYFIGITDPESQMKLREKAIAAVVAVVNSFYLFASTTGIASAVLGGG